MKKMILFALAAFMAMAQAVAAEPARAGTVVLVHADQVQRDAGWQSSPATVIGGLVGGAAGRYAARNTSRQRGAASLIGAAVGAAVGRSIDTRQVQGYTVIVRLDAGLEVAVFTKRPTVRRGERVYLVGDRLVAGGAP